MNVGCNERRFDEMQSQQENEVMKLFYYKLMSFSVQLIFYGYCVHVLYVMISTYHTCMYMSSLQLADQRTHEACDSIWDQNGTN